MGCVLLVSSPNHPFSLPSRRGEWCFYPATASSHMSAHKHHSHTLLRSYEPEGLGTLELGLRFASQLCHALTLVWGNGPLPIKKDTLNTSPAQFFQRSNGVPISKTPHMVLCILWAGAAVGMKCMFSQGTGMDSSVLLSLRLVVMTNPFSAKGSASRVVFRSGLIDVGEVSKLLAI